MLLCEKISQTNTRMDNTLMEQHPLALDDGRRIAPVLDGLVHLVQHVQNRLHQVIVHRALLSRHRVRQVLQQLVHRQPHRLLAHQRDLPQRADRRTAALRVSPRPSSHLPVAHHRRLLQSHQQGLEQGGTVSRPRGEEVDAVAQEPHCRALQRGDVLAVLLQRRGEVQQAEDLLCLTSPNDPNI